MEWIKPLVFTIVAIAAVAEFVIMIRRKSVIWQWGLPAERTDDAGRRLGIFISEVLFQSRVIKGRPFAGLMHAFVFWGFCFFALGTLDHFSRAYFPAWAMQKSDATTDQGSRRDCLGTRNVDSEVIFG